MSPAQELVAGTAPSPTSAQPGVCGRSEEGPRELVALTLTASVPCRRDGVPPRDSVGLSIQVRLGLISWSFTKWRFGHRSRGARGRRPGVEGVGSSDGG